MGKRLTQIATRTGDDGTTGLGDNTRVPKDHLRVRAMGDVDELNSHIGLLLCEELPADARELLVEIQHQLFNLGGELSIPGFELLKADALLALDQALEQYNTQLPRLQEFILPGGNRAAAQAHVPYRRAPCRAGRGRARCAGQLARRTAPVPQSPLRPDVRAGARLQPHARRRRRVLEKRTALPLAGQLTGRR
jgi:cob(I)alamin adenosyltransferase